MNERQLEGANLESYSQTDLLRGGDAQLQPEGGRVFRGKGRL